MSAYEHPELIALDEVEDILEAYAEARLSPSGPLLSRMRTAVLAEAHAMAAQAARTAAAAAAVTPMPQPWYRVSLPRLDGPRWQVPRFAAALGFAVALGVGTSTAVTAAPPGSPFYNARVALEAILLPTQIDERLAAHEQHLDARLAEAEGAAARGDFVALDAALAAYRVEVDVAIAEVGEDRDRLASLQAVLEKHIAKLSALAARLPTAVARDNAAAHAVDASERAAAKAVEKVKAKQANSKPPSPPRVSNPPSRPTAPPRQSPNPDNRPAEPGR
ncbi:MAG TPA: DUF5667 domain-containing protein [Candidatus Limnocylindrales bacterium]|nr:DUF5667 domain-containing protein [Candidatus Limnocylindrales bacterium]